MHHIHHGDTNASHQTLYTAKYNQGMAEMQKQQQSGQNTRTVAPSTRWTASAELMKDSYK